MATAPKGRAQPGLGQALAVADGLVLVVVLAGVRAVEQDAEVAVRQVSAGHVVGVALAALPVVVRAGASGSGEQAQCPGAAGVGESATGLSATRMGVRHR